MASEEADTAVETPVEAPLQAASEAEIPAGYAVTEEPTAERPRDANGRELDEWGLPRNGPARVDALCQLGKRDPRTHPEDWSDEPAKSARRARKPAE